VYWKGDEPFYAFGMGAASLIEELRFSRPRTLKSYEDWVKNLQGARSLEDSYSSDHTKETEGSIEFLKSVVMGRLRVDTGLRIDDVKKYFPSNRGEELDTFFLPYQELGLVRNQEGIVRLTPPQGFLAYEEITSRLFAFIEDSFCKE
jgi:oxygen-independent coproporphyrinogen-3 oxidase